MIQSIFLHINKKWLSNLLENPSKGMNQHIRGREFKWEREKEAPTSLLTRYHCSPLVTMIICNFIEIMSKQSPEFLLESRC
jgi:hypothetical protein